MNALYGNTHDELILKMLGYWHDHCHHFYVGLTENVPEKYLDLIEEDYKYVFIYEEDKPTDML